MGVGDAPTDLLAQGLPRIDDRVVIAAVDLVGQTVRPSDVERGHTVSSSPFLLRM